MPHLLTMHGVAVLLGLPVADVRRLVATERIPYVALPTGDVRFIEADVLEWARSGVRPATC